MSGKESSVLIRQCHTEIFQEIMKNPNILNYLVLGNPGIGKSWFLVYALLRFRLEHQKRRVVFESARQNTAWIFDDNGVMEILNSRSEKAFYSAVRDPNCVYLYDPVGTKSQEPAGRDGLTIVASSPNVDSYKDFLKDKCDVLYMPCWSEEEIDHLAQKENFHGVNPEVAKKRYDEIGGIPRYVFTEQLVYDRYRGDISRAIKAFDINSLFGDGSVETTLKSTHKLMQVIPLTVEKKDELTDTDKQLTDYRNFTIDFLTPRLRDLTIAELFTKKIDHGYELVTRPSATVLSGSRGTIFEELVWLCLTKEQAETRQWRYWDYTKPADKITTKISNTTTGDTTTTAKKAESRKALIKTFPRLSKFPYGSVLPTEFELNTLYVSNHTNNPSYEAFFLLESSNNPNKRELYVFQLKTDKAGKLSSRDVKDAAIKDLSYKTKCDQIHVCMVLLPTEFDKFMNSTMAPLTQTNLDTLLTIQNLDIKVFSSPVPTK
jgi:hypothetical protein